MFLKAYDIEHVNGSLSGWDEKTVRKGQWIVFDALARLKIILANLL